MRITATTKTGIAKKRPSSQYTSYAASFCLAWISMNLASVDAFGVMSTTTTTTTTSGSNKNVRRRRTLCSPPQHASTTAALRGEGDSAVARPYARSGAQEGNVLEAAWPTKKAALTTAMNSSGKTQGKRVPSSEASPVQNDQKRTQHNQGRRKTRAGMQRPKLQQHARIVQTSSSSSSTSSFWGEKHNEPSSRTSKGLTRQKEIQYSFQIRTLRAAMRLRDQHIAECHIDNENDDVQLVGVPSRQRSSRQQEQQQQVDVDPDASLLSDQTWAKACGTSVSDLHRLLQEGQAARTAMCAANAGLVTSLAKRHHASLQKATTAGGGVGTILSLQDLMQEGNLGLMEAAERFEPERNVRFSTYATWWIRQRMLRSIADSSRIIRLPAHVHGMLSKMSKRRNALQAILGRPPTDEEMAQDLSVSVTQLRKYADSSRNVVSLELPVGTSSFTMDRRTLGDSLASQAPSPEEAAVAQSLQRDVQRVLAGLSDRERQVLELRFGLTPASSEPGTRARTDPLTVAETAACMEITPDRVRVLEARALNKLRHPRRNYRLKEYVTSSSSSSSSSPSSSKVNHHKRIRTTPSGSATLRHHPSVGGGRVSIKTEPKTVRIVSQSSTSALHPFSEQGNDLDDDDFEDQDLPSRQERLWFF